MSAEIHDQGPITLAQLREEFLPKVYRSNDLKAELLGIIPLEPEELEEMLEGDESHPFKGFIHLKDAYVTAKFIRSYGIDDLTEEQMSELVRKPLEHYDGLTMAELFKTRQFERVIQRMSRTYGWSATG